MLVETPGHSHGHLSVFVNLPSGKRFFVAGDVAWVRDNYALPARKSWLARTLMEPAWRDEALLRVRRLSEVAPDVTSLNLRVDMKVKRLETVARSGLEQKSTL